MTTTRQNFENSTVGASAATGGTTGGNTAVAAIGTAPVITNTAGEVINGSLSAKAVAASGAASGLTLNATISGGKIGTYSVLSFLDSSLGALDQVHSVRQSTGKLAYFQLTSARVPQIVNAAGSVVATLSSPLAFPGIYIFELLVDTGTTTTNGKIKYGIRNFADGSFTAGLTGYVELTGQNTGAGAAPVSIQVGWTTAAAAARNLTIDDLYIVDSYTTTGPVVNNPPTISAGSTVIVTSGTTASVVFTATDTDGTIASFQTPTVTSSQPTAPTVGAPTLSGIGTATATATYPVSGLSNGDTTITTKAVDNSGDASISAASARILYTSTTPLARSVTLNGATMISPTSGTPLAAVNAWLTSPTTVAPPVFATASPPAAGAGVIVVYQPLDSTLVAPTFGQTWAAADLAVPVTVYVDLKFNGTTRATVSQVLTTTPTNISRIVTSTENTAIGTDRSTPSVESRFA